MLRYYGLLLGICMSSLALAQPGWNWPEDPTLEKLAKEKQAFYKMQMQLENYPAAFNALNWLYKNNPNLNESIYIDGAKVLDNILETELPSPRKKSLEDSLLWTFDARIKHFNNESTVMDRKAYSAFKLYYKTSGKYPMLLELYEQLYSYPASDISDFNLTPYMTLATYYFKSNPQEMSAEKVLDIHEKITEVIDEKKMNGGNLKKLQKEQDKVDAFLGSLGGTLSCDFIEMNMVPKFNRNPTDLNLAKKVFSYSLKAKCFDKPYFVKAGEVYYKENPSYSLAKTLADRFISANNLDKALEYYGKADSLASNQEEKYNIKLGTANILAKKGDKQQARATAYEALSIQPDAPEAYNLIGNMYFTSAEDCKGGVSIVKDRAVYLAAYKMYEKAGNSDQMNASREQFPSMEEIFNEGYEVGQKITVNCWINESVSIQRRD